MDICYLEIENVFHETYLMTAASDRYLMTAASDRSRLSTSESEITHGRRTCKKVRFYHRIIYIVRTQIYRRNYDIVCRQAKLSDISCPLWPLSMPGRKSRLPIPRASLRSPRERQLQWIKISWRIADKSALKSTLIARNVPRIRPLLTGSTGPMGAGGITVDILHEK